MLSTGRATIPEAEQACAVLRNGSCTDVTLLHCNSAYPPQAEDCNLAAMGTMRDACQRAVGWSDHTMKAGVTYWAVHRWGATMGESPHHLKGQGPELAAEGDAVVERSRSELEARHGWADLSDGLRPMAANRVVLAQGTRK